MKKRLMTMGKSTRHMIFDEIRYKLDNMRKYAGVGDMTEVRIYNKEIEGFVDALLYTGAIGGLEYHRLYAIKRNTYNECFETLKTTLKLD